jgi:hypothetical protein
MRRDRRNGTAYSHFCAHSFVSALRIVRAYRFGNVSDVDHICAMTGLTRGESQEAAGHSMAGRTRDAMWSIVLRIRSRLAVSNEKTTWVTPTSS